MHGAGRAKGSRTVALAMAGALVLALAWPASPAGPIPLIAPTLVSGGAHATVRLRSRPDLAPPAVRILRRLPAAGSSDIFLTPQFGPSQNGPMILAADGRLVWFKPVPRRYIASDLRVQTYQGQPVLTWWQGYTAAGVGAGTDVVYNSSYRQVASVQAANGLQADMHEFELTSSGTALITA